MKKRKHRVVFPSIFNVFLKKHQWMTEKRFVIVPWAVFTLMV